ncbi:MAG TPA: DUF2934 domain-containing protein [Candidatus Binataceae bacterium]|jgi:hypothetical protein|nr:DUF2934 domain-containing protein [Candidatus Binataceae bacterium]
MRKNRPDKPRRVASKTQSRQVKTASATAAAATDLMNGNGAGYPGDGITMPSAGGNGLARVTVQPTVEQIRERAYELFLRRDGAPGDALSDWLDAERELRARLAADS